MSQKSDEMVKVIATKPGFDGIASRKEGDVFMVKKERYSDGSGRAPTSWMKLADEADDEVETKSAAPTSEAGDLGHKASDSAETKPDTTTHHAKKKKTLWGKAAKKDVI